MSIPEFTYGDRVRRVRLDTGLTQDEFAEQIGVTQAVISRHEKLDAPPSRNTRSLALLIQLRYDVPAKWTLAGEIPVQRELGQVTGEYRMFAPVLQLRRRIA